MIPKIPPLLAHKKRIVLIASALFFTFIYFIFFPSYIVSIDEHEYAKNAVLMSQGSPLSSNNQFYCGGRELQGLSNRFSSDYPIGKSILLMPFLPFGFDALFIFGFIIHILNFILAILILKKLKMDELWALFYLFFPAFQWASRTLYPESLVLTFFMGAYYWWHSETKNSSLASGFLLGCSVWVRPDSIMGGIGFGIHSLLNERKRFWPFLIGFALPVLILLLFNVIYYNNIFGTLFRGASVSGESVLGRNFGLGYLAELAAFILLILVAVPFSFVSVLRPRRDRLIFVIISILTLLFSVRFLSFWALEKSIPHLLTVRLRYFIPLLGLLLIPTIQMYTDWLAKMREKIPRLMTYRNYFAMVIFLVLGIGTLSLHDTHRELTDSRKIIYSHIHEQIPENATVIGSADDCIYFLPPFTGTKYYSKVTDLPTDYSLMPNTFILDISYNTQKNEDVERQKVVDAERQKIKDFISNHVSVLIKKFELTNGSTLRIWRVSS